MDTRAMIAELCETSDKLDRETDEVLARLASKRSPQLGPPLVYKTREPKPAPSLKYAMLAGVLGLAEEVGSTTGKMASDLAKLHAKVAELEAEIGNLRADLEVARASNVTDMRGRNVA